MLESIIAISTECHNPSVVFLDDLESAHRSPSIDVVRVVVFFACFAHVSGSPNCVHSITLHLSIYVAA